MSRRDEDGDLQGTTPAPIDHAALAERWFNEAERSHWPEHLERAKFHADMARLQADRVPALLEQIVEQLRVQNLIAVVAYDESVMNGLIDGTLPLRLPPTHPSRAQITDLHARLGRTFAEVATILGVPT